MASLLDLAERVRNSFQQKATQGLANVQRGIGTAALNMQTGVGNVRSAVQDWQAKPSNQVFNALKTPQGQQQLLSTANKNASFLPKPIGQPLNFIANLGINRTVAPLMQVPYNVKEAIGGQQKSLPQRGLHGLMAAGGAFPLDDPLWMGYDFLKGSNKYDERNKGIGTNLKSGLQSMSLQKPVGLGEVIAPQGTARDIANVAELPALLVAGGVKTKNLKDRTKILNNETNIKAAVGWLSKWGDRFVDPDMSFRRYDHIVKTAKEIIPEVYNSKYMKKMEQYDPDGWAKTMASILDGTLEQAKNPQLNIGFNVRDISKRKDAQAPGGSGILKTKDINGNEVEELFIKSATKSEKIGGKSRQDGFNKIKVPKEWETIVYKPYGENGAGYYLRRNPQSPVVQAPGGSGIKDLAIRKNSPQELAYDLARKLNNFELGDIKLTKEQKIELQQWDNKYGNKIMSTGLPSIKESPKWIKDIWESTQIQSKPTVVQAPGVSGIEPWKMTKTQWDEARELLKPNVAQSNYTKSSKNTAEGRIKDLENLTYGVREQASEKIKLAIQGKLKLKPGEAEQLQAILNTPVSHKEVVIKALDEGRNVPKNVLDEYPDLRSPVAQAPVSDIRPEAQEWLKEAEGIMNKIKSKDLYMGKITLDRAYEARGDAPINTLTREVETGLGDIGDIVQSEPSLLPKIKQLVETLPEDKKIVITDYLRKHNSNLDWSTTPPAPVSGTPALNTPEAVQRGKKLLQNLRTGTSGDAPIAKTIAREVAAGEKFVNESGTGIKLNNSWAKSYREGTTPTKPQATQLDDEWTQEVFKGSKLPPQAAVDDVVKTEKAVGKKVNLLDWFRTPDRVLKKLGLEKEGTLIRNKYNDYLQALPKEIDKVTQWANRVKGNPNASREIFRYLDGEKSVGLTGEELKVADEMKQYLSQWADKLDLPQDKRIASYITHIFDQDFIKKEFDEDLAKMITDKIPGSVYDPFLQQRLGKQGYVQDAFRALDAYVKRATRKFHMDQALTKLQDKAGRSFEESPLDIGSFRYVQEYVDRINLRPTQVDNYLDNLVKSIPGIGYKFGQRPTANITRGMRQAVYRGTLGLNFGSALKNLTQGVNTYSKLGEVYTPIGYTKAAKALLTGDDELARVGVLSQQFVQDRTLSATKKIAEKFDKGLFVFFDLAEKINRGAAYYGAKTKALRAGKSEAEAVQAGLDLARQTQFTFGSVDTPVVLQSDLAKLISQFQSYNVKQAEFLGEMVQKKELLGLLRWAGANLAIMYGVGELLGMDKPTDFLPFSGILTGETKIGETPVTKTALDLGKAVANAPDKYGNISKDSTPKRVLSALKQNAPAFIPAGVQAKKTIQGLGAVNQGYSENASGNVQYPIAQTTSNKVIGGLLGKSRLPEANKYFDEQMRPLSEKQSALFKQAGDRMGTYNQIIKNRKDDAAIEKAKESIKQSGNSQVVGDMFLYLADNGDVKSVDLNFQPKEPKLTGIEAVDKKLISKYTGQITSKTNDIIELLENNQITAEQAGAAITALEDLKTKASGKFKKPKKINISIKKVTAPKPNFKLKLSKPKKVTLKKLPKLKVTKSKKRKLKI